MGKTRNVTIKNITYITPIQMDGPIVTPMTLSESIVKELVRRGYNVYEKIGGNNVRLTLANFNNPTSFVRKQDAPAVTTPTTKPKVPDKRFSNNAPVVANAPTPTPRPAEVPKAEETTNYDFGKEVDAVDTSIAPDEEAVGRLFTGRPIPDVSPDVEAITEVDLAQEGTVEAGKPENTEEVSVETTEEPNTQENKSPTKP